MIMKIVSASEDDLLPTSINAEVEMQKRKKKLASWYNVSIQCTTTARYKMGIGPDRMKVTTNNSNGFQREIKVKDQRQEAVENLKNLLEAVENLKYRGAIISNEGSKPEILSSISQTTAALSRLEVTWRDKNISFASKHANIIHLRLCESWTLTTELQRRM